MSQERPPVLPAQNPKQEHLDKMARYQSRLDQRLSQPKLNSPVRRDPSMSSINQSIDYTQQLNSKKGSPSARIEKRLISSSKKHNASVDMENPEAIAYEEFGTITKGSTKQSIKNNSSVIDLLHSKIAKPSIYTRNSMGNTAGLWETANNVTS